MTHDKNFKDESQDARRKDQHNQVHPDETSKKSEDSTKRFNKSSVSPERHKK